MSEIFNYQKLYSAYLNCRKNKRNTIDALRFEWDLENNLFALLKALESKKYKPGRSICFAVLSPTPREIFAAEFCDRVTHHLFVNEVEKEAEKKFIYDSFACRTGKGAYSAVDKLKKMIKKASNNNQRKIFFAQLDISGFFMAIDHWVLYDIFKKLIAKHENKSKEWQNNIIWLGEKIIFHRPADNYIIIKDASALKLIPLNKSLFNSPVGKGLPIGNYSSQFFANLYMNELDQFVKRTLGCKYYLRYMDDFIILDKDKEKLEYYKNKISVFLNDKLLLELKQNKTKINLINSGIDFLGYFIKPDYTLVRRKVLKRLKLKLNINNFTELKKILQVVNSYYGHFRKADSSNLRKNIFYNYFDKDQKNRFSLSKNAHFLRLNKN